METKEKLDDELKKVIEEYQCSGCVCGSSPNDGCFEKSRLSGIGCGKHVPGTMISNIGTIFLGLPKGFNRLGPDKTLRPLIYDNIKQKNESFGCYDNFNVPVWKHINESGHLLLKGMSPRINFNFLHIILDSKGHEEIKCLELTSEEIEKID